MIAVEIDASELGLFGAALLPGYVKACQRALKAEAYRLMRREKEVLRAGVGPEKAPLTRAEAKRRAREALAAFAPIAAYEVASEAAGGALAVIGLTAQPMMRRRRALPSSFRDAIAGKTLTITPELRREIAATLRKRGRKDLSKLPKPGTEVTFPARDFVRPLAAAEAANSSANMAKLIVMALTGQRWERTWWAP